MQVAEDIFLLDGAEPDSNVYVIDGELMVDTGSGLYLEETLEQMDNYGINPEGIKLIALTHAHFTHCGAVGEMKDETKAKVGIHEEELDKLETGEGIFTSCRAEEETPSSLDYKGVSPDILLNEEETIKTSSYEFQVLHTPGHTEGSISLWEPEEGILVSGDLIQLDGEDPHADSGVLAESLEKVKGLEIDVLLPGHGPPARKDNPYTEDAVEEALENV